MYPFNIPGVSNIGTDNIGTISFALNADADENTIKSLINDIPSQKVVMFFDKDHPSPSDPGAYVEFMRVDNQYIMKRSNHGWSSRWRVVHNEELENYLQKCSNIHTMNEKHFEVIRFYSIVNIPPSEQIDSQEKIDREGKRAKFLKIFLTLLFILLFVWLYFSYYR
ncbi:MAG: hypothetical protein ACXW4Q_09990 [Anaerolineales bacterium]